MILRFCRGCRRWVAAAQGDVGHDRPVLLAKPGRDSIAQPLPHGVEHRQAAPCGAACFGREPQVLEAELRLEAGRERAFGDLGAVAFVGAPGEKRAKDQIEEARPF